MENLRLCCNITIVDISDTSDYISIEIIRSNDQTYWLKGCPLTIPTNTSSATKTLLTAIGHWLKQEKNQGLAKWHYLIFRKVKLEHQVTKCNIRSTMPYIPIPIPIKNIYSVNSFWKLPLPTGIHGYKRARIRCRNTRNNNACPTKTLRVTAPLPPKWNEPRCLYSRKRSIFKVVAVPLSTPELNSTSISRSISKNQLKSHKRFEKPEP